MYMLFSCSCVEVEEHHAVDIDVYHCPNCDAHHGPSLSMYPLFGLLESIDSPLPLYLYEVLQIFLFPVRNSHYKTIYQMEAGAGLRGFSVCLFS